MSATRPASKTELKDYALRRLGFPTIDINVATEQLDDLIEEAIDYYQEYHYNGSIQTFMRIEVTEAIKTQAKGFTQEGSTPWYGQDNYVSTPPGTLGVNHVYTNIGASSIVPGNIFNIKYKNLCLEQLDDIIEDNILCEPAMRNTAPCIAYASFKINQKKQLS